MSKIGCLKCGRMFNVYKDCNNTCKDCNEAESKVRCLECWKWVDKTTEIEDDDGELIDVCDDCLIEKQ